MYKNANRILLKDVCLKESLRHSIALSRIEQNLKQVKSMIHVIAPEPFDDVLLFNARNSEDGESCTALYCNVLWCTVLWYTALYCTVLYCTVLCAS
jgi:hypothetical protein